MKESKFTLLAFTLLVSAISLTACLSNSSQIPKETYSAQSVGNNNLTSAIHYDGVYFVPYGKIAASYIRFYEDGTVINITSTGAPDQIKAWFDRGAKNLSTGSYIIKGNQISFTVISPQATVEYTGTIINNGLLLSSRANNGHESNDIRYVFYKW